MANCEEEEVNGERSSFTLNLTFPICRWLWAEFPSELFCIVLVSASSDFLGKKDYFEHLQILAWHTIALWRCLILSGVKYLVSISRQSCIMSGLFAIHCPLYRGYLSEIQTQTRPINCSTKQLCCQSEELWKYSSDRVIRPMHLEMVCLQREFVLIVVTFVL